MNYYTSQIPLPLAEKLKEKGMPIHIWRDMFKDNGGTDATFASCFDWLIEKGTMISIYPFITEIGTVAYKLIIKTVRNNKVTTHCTNVYLTWHEAANTAIEKALT